MMSKKEANLSEKELNIISSFNSLPDSAIISGRIFGILANVSRTTRWKKRASGELSGTIRGDEYTAGDVRAYLKGRLEDV